MVSLAGCAATASSRHGGPPGKSSGRRLASLDPVGLAADVADLQRLYDTGNWSMMSGVVADQDLATALLGRMRFWKREGVSNLHVNLVYSHPLGAGRYVGTVRFAADPRAVPEYFIFVFDRAGKGARVVGTTTGLSGSDFAHASWSVSRSAHFVVFHSPYQLMGADRAVLNDLEYQRQQFVTKFGVKLPSLARYYLYPTTSLMSAMTRGGCGSHVENVGCAQPYVNPPTIQTVLWPTYHEPIHVYQLALVPPGHGNLVWEAPLFIGEGMAVALEERNLDPSLSDYCSDLIYAPLDSCARVAAAHVKPMTILSDTGFDSVDPGYAYALAGSFVKYLILHGGYRRFGRFYYVLAAQPKDRVVDYDVAARRVYGVSTETLIQRWSTALCHNGCP